VSRINKTFRGIDVDNTRESSKYTFTESFRHENNKDSQIKDLHSKSQHLMESNNKLKGIVKSFIDDENLLNSM